MLHLRRSQSDANLDGFNPDALRRPTKAARDAFAVVAKTGHELQLLDVGWRETTKRTHSSSRILRHTAHFRSLKSRAALVGMLDHVRDRLLT